MSNYTADVVELDALWSEILDLSSAELDLELHSLGISLEKVDNSFAALERCAAFSALPSEVDFYQQCENLFIPECIEKKSSSSLFTIAVCGLRKSNEVVTQVLIRRHSAFSDFNKDLDLRSSIPMPANFPWHVHNN